MKKMFFALINLFLFALSSSSQVKVGNLLTENLVDPVGIDVLQPRFTWQLMSDQRNVLQSAYEIKVSLVKKLSGAAIKYRLINRYKYHTKEAS